MCMSVQLLEQECPCLYSQYLSYISWWVELVGGAPGNLFLQL